MNWRGQWSIVLLAFLAGAVALAGQHLLQNRQDIFPAHDGNPARSGQTKGLVGSSRIDLALPDNEGKIRRLSEWDGQRVLLNFWATWCAPCREELPRLNAAQRRYAGQGVQVIGIAVDLPERVDYWLERHPASYPVLIDNSNGHQTARAYGSEGVVPYNVLIGPDGTVLQRAFGALSEAQLERWLQPDLSAAGHAAP